MKCPNCVLGDLQFLIRGELRFATDSHGRPCGTADIHTTGDRFRMRCDTCNAGFGVHGWQDDGTGEVILSELDSRVDDPRIAAQEVEDSQIGMEPESPPPGNQRVD